MPGRHCFAAAGRSQEITAILHCLFNAAWILAVLFIPLIAYQYTNNIFLISLMLAVYNAAFFISSLVFGRFGDTRSRRRVVGLGFLTSALIYTAHLLIKNTGTMFLIRGLAGWTSGMIPGSLTALAWGTSLGLFTGLGSLGMLIANLLAAVIKSDTLIFLTAALFSLLGFSLIFGVRENGPRLKVPRLPVRIMMRNLNVYLPFLIRHSAAQAIWAVYPLYLFQLGATRFQISMIYALNPLSQFIFMLALERWKSVTLMKMGVLASAAAFLGFGLATNLWVILAFQVVLGYSWANLYMGSVKYLLENNTEQATAGGILNSLIGLSGIIGPLLGGAVALAGIKTMILASAALACLAYLISSRLQQK